MLVPKEMHFLNFEIVKGQNTFSLPSEIIQYMELIFLLQGKMEYYINDIPVSLRAGDAILFPPGSKRQRLFTDTPVKYANINIQIMSPYVFPIVGHIRHCICHDTEFFLEKIEKEYKAASTNREEKCIALFNYIFAQLLDTVCNFEDQRIKEIKQYIINNLKNDLNLEIIASVIHLSSCYCSTFFKQQTGTSLTQYILQQRIDKAKNLIATTDMQLSEIAEQCGFKNYNYFCQVFKKYIGITASECRNKSYWKNL